MNTIYKKNLNILFQNLKYKKFPFNNSGSYTCFIKLSSQILNIIISPQYMEDYYSKN